MITSAIAEINYLVLWRDHFGKYMCYFKSLVRTMCLVFWSKKIFCRLWSNVCSNFLGSRQCQWHKQSNQAVKFALKYPSKRWFKSIRTETLTWGRGGTYGPQLKNFTRPCIDSECTGLVMCFPSIKKDLKILFFKVDSFQIERLSPAKSGIKHRFKQFDKIYETFFQNADL